MLVTSMPGIDCSSVPEALQLSVKTSLISFYQQLSEHNLMLVQTPKLMASMSKVWASSEFVPDSCLAK
ncbi:hypothetical protein, partial [Methylicorpusculum sp.]|uniref:hypothetical protein n=1 Tax=Methylicorpusculum sp. TaxID=2713644 RepID=UPI002ABA7EFB